MNSIDELEVAFGARREPERLSPTTLPSDERDEVESFRGLDWTSLTCDHLAGNYSAIFAFAPDAFRYFLPRILAAGMRENRSDLLAYDAVLGELDRSPEREYWEDGFVERWAGLSPDECRAVQSWLLWLQEHDPGIRFENAIDRAFDTLSLLAENAADPS